MDKQGYVSQLKSMVSELRQYEVAAEDLEEILDDLEKRPELYYKLKDITVLYRGFLSIWVRIFIPRRKCWMYLARWQKSQKS